MVRERAELLAVEDLEGADSLVVVELVMDIEDAVGVELTETDVLGVSSLDGLADLVLTKLAERHLGGSPA